MLAHNPKSIDEIMAKFTIKTLPSIELYPNYKSINEIMQLLYSKMTDLPTPQGGGLHGHISIIMNPMIYTTLVTMAYTNPPEPGVYPTIPINTTIALREKLQLQHNEGRIIYYNAITMDESLNIQVIDTGKYTYMKEFNNNYTGLLRATCCNLLNHLLD